VHDPGQEIERAVGELVVFDQDSNEQRPSRCVYVAPGAS
jgi:hypothetical protein